MRFSVLLTILLIVTACGRAEVRSSGYSPAQALRDAYSTIAEQNAQLRDPNGFIDVEHCDSLLFSSLNAVGADITIDIYSARNEQGQWFRRPLDYPECYASGFSKSSISRDMLLGLMWYLWSTRDLQGLQALYDYGEERNWIMGEGDSARINLRLGLQTTLEAAIRRLKGDRLPLIELADPFLGSPTGYEAHLQVLHILLRGEIYGSLSQSTAGKLLEQHKRQPRNPLFAYASARYVTGDYALAERLLLGGIWPLDRLATSEDYCSPWPIERDDGADWLPCNQGKLHSNGDWLFVARLLLRQ
jgi:hypothetical protein